LTGGNDQPSGGSDKVAEGSKIGEKANLESSDVAASRNASAQDMQSVESVRTNSSDGSLSKYVDLPKAADTPIKTSIQLVAYQDGQEQIIDKTTKLTPNERAKIQYSAESAALEAPVLHERTNGGGQSAPSSDSSIPVPTPVYKPLPPLQTPSPIAPESLKFVPQPVAPVIHKFEAPSPISPSIIESRLSGASTDAAEKTMEQASDGVKHDLEAAKRRLTENAERMISNPDELAHFKQDMANFENNYLARTHKEPELAVREISETMNNVSTIFENESTLFPDNILKGKQLNPTDTSFRVRLAEEVLHHCAEPTTVDQGYRITCQVEALQVREYWRDPAAVSKLVAGVFQTGVCPGRNGKLDLAALTNPRGSTLLPDEEATRYPPYKGDAAAMRGYASKLFDVAAVNIGMQYALPGASYTEGDGKRSFIKYPGKAERSELGGSNLPALKAEHLADINEKIIGEREVGFIVIGWPLNAANGNFDEKYDAALELEESHAAFVKVRNGKELSAKLLAMKELGQWPPILSCRSDSEPLSTSWQKAFGNSNWGHGFHFVNLPTISDDGSHCSMDNTWSKKSDLENVSVEVLASNTATVRTKQDATYLTDLATNQKWIDAPNGLALAKKDWFSKLSADSVAHPQTAMKDWVNSHPIDTYAKLWYQNHPHDKDGSKFLKWMQNFCKKYHK
jgi:hypothetical protein